MISNIKFFADLDGTLAVWQSAASYESLFEKGYFRNLAPHESVVEAVRELYKRGATELYSLSAVLEESPYAKEEKHEWIDEYLPEIPESHRLFCPTNIKKAEYVAHVLGEPMGPHFFLLDDYSKNLHEWRNAGGTGIKLMNGINGSVGTWTGDSVSRFCSGKHLAAAILEILGRTAA